ncbi:MAG: hypothetical protein EAX81_00280 [Candidatus Thorarchaeota archaeon]|nr:hypothetical protein [Candidatus Thorarchaeota archaeon]
MTKDEIPDGPMKARADLVDMLSANPEITKSIVSIIESELKDIQDKEVFDKICTTLKEVAFQAGVETDARDNILYWLTETTPDVREMILVRTIEDLLNSEQTRGATLDALANISSKENVEIVIEWVNSNILTLNQAVYVLLYPDSSSALK